MIFQQWWREESGEVAEQLSLVRPQSGILKRQINCVGLERRMLDDAL